MKATKNARAALHAVRAVKAVKPSREQLYHSTIQSKCQGGDAYGIQARILGCHPGAGAL